MLIDGEKNIDDTVCSFLMIGQSNMAGRGDIGDVPRINNNECYMLRMGRWQKMSEPINPDRAIFEGRFRSGIGLAASFADGLSRERGIKVGLIPCADGGTEIDEWMPGTALYEHALAMTKIAMRYSRLSGILWHQGESDCKSEEGLLLHRGKFIQMITALRRDLGCAELPLVIGELSENIGEAWGFSDRPRRMNLAYHEIARELPACGVASAAGLELKNDGIHFNSLSLRSFGKRYLDVYLGLTEK